MPLTNEQKDVVKKLIKNLYNDQVQTLGGFAGTGKSTVIRVLMDALHQKHQSFRVGAYTGKATNVLRKKGLHADTIHGMIYQPYTDDKGETAWSLVPVGALLEEGVDGFIVDEASMVSKEIHDDLMSYGLPIIYVGDHGQLEPIGTKFNLMQQPMYRLETVHRNANEIAHFAQHLRQGKPATAFHGSAQVQIVRETAIEDRHLASVDQIICAFNRTRVSLNERVRTEKKIQYTFIAKGEKVICLRNRKREGLYNGMQGIVTKIHKDEKFDFVADDKFFEKVEYDPDQFGKESNQFEFSQKPHPFDYAYAITCHKAQGDEWGNVIVYEQHCDKWDSARWAYTAASRAKNGLIWIGVEDFRPSYL